MDQQTIPPFFHIFKLCAAHFPGILQVMMTYESFFVLESRKHCTCNVDFHAQSFNTRQQRTQWHDVSRILSICFTVISARRLSICSQHCLIFRFQIKGTFTIDALQFHPPVPHRYCVKQFAFKRYVSCKLCIASKYWSRSPRCKDCCPYFG